MLGALTAADGFTDPDALEEEQRSAPTGYEVGVSSGIVADLTPVYDAAIRRLREQRQGMSARERLGALLVGFGQPTRSGKWQESVGNASQLLFQQSMARRKEDVDRRRELERLMNAREVARIRSQASVEAAKVRAGAPPKPSQRVQVSVNPLTGEPEAFNIQVENGIPVVKRVAIGGEAQGSVLIPEINEPDQGAQHPESPVVKTPMGLMKNPFYKGG